MKRLFTLLLISFATLSCEMIDEKLDDLLDKRDWVVFAEGTELTANVPSKQTVLNYKFESTLDWEVKTDVEWLEIDPMSGKAGKDIKIQIKVLHNKDKEGRTGYAYLTLSNNESYRITINQAGEDDENDEGDENEEIVVEIPNNQIWYTSIDGEIVEPYSDEGNNYADAPTTFGVNIVSNTYKDGKGVIEFDGDVTTIGDSAFEYCSSLISVTIPDSVTEIGEDAFYGCSSLTSVTIPDSVTTIGDYAFDECYDLTSVTIGDSVTTIGYAAFAWCANLASINIPDSATTIGECAFYNCSSLTSVTIPNSVITIGDKAFAGCNELKEFKGKFASEDGRCLIIDGVLNSFAPARLTEYTIPDSVTTIGENAFYQCSSLTSVTIPDSVTTIGDEAFSHCSSLTSVTIPDSVTTIGENAFYQCRSLTSVYCKPTTPPTTIVDYNGYWCAFDENASARKIYVPMESVEAYKSAEWWSEYEDAIVGYDFDRNEEVVQPEQPEEIPNNQIWYTSTDGEVVEPYSGEDNEYADAITTFGVNIVSNTYVDGKGVIEFDGDVTTIGDWAFGYCNSLTSIIIPDSVTTIERSTFRGCSSLTSVTIPDRVTTIGDRAFIGCESLTSVIIGEGVTTIGEWAFHWCERLTSVTIPDSVTEIGNHAFHSCRSLTSVYCKPTTPPAALLYNGYWEAFDNNASGRKIYVPMESVEAYKSAEWWSEYASSIEGYNF